MSPGFVWSPAAGLKVYGIFVQTTLAKTLIAACGLDERRNKNARNAVAWRKGGQGGGQSAGNFAAAMQEVRLECCTDFTPCKPTACERQCLVSHDCRNVSMSIIITYGVTYDMCRSLTIGT